MNDVKGTIHAIGGDKMESDEEIRKRYYDLFLHGILAAGIMTFGMFILTFTGGFPFVIGVPLSLIALVFMVTFVRLAWMLRRPKEHAYMYSTQSTQYMSDWEYCTSANSDDWEYCTTDNATGNKINWCISNGRKKMR